MEKMETEGRSTANVHEMSGPKLPPDWTIQTSVLHSFNSKDRCHVKKVSHHGADKGQGDLVQVFFIHDIFEHSMRWYPLIENLLPNCPENYHFILHDLKGHGMSTGTRTHIDDFSVYCKDLATLINLCKQHRHQKSKIILIGQGMGSLVILKAIEQYRHLIDATIGGVVLLNPSFKLAFEIPYALKVSSNNCLSFLPKIRLARPFSGNDLFEFTVDAEEYNADPLIPNFLSLGLMTQLLKSTKELRQFSYFVDAPSLFLCGKKGPLFDPDSAFLFHKGIPNTQSLYLQYPECKHGLLYGQNKEEIMLTIKNWIQKIGDEVTSV